MFALVAAVLLCILIFFKVDTVSVEGNVHYTTEEVVAASGISQGDNMVMLNRAGVTSEILARLPYINHVQISRTLPDQVIIQVTDCDAGASAVSDTG